MVAAPAALPASASAQQAGEILTPVDVRAVFVDVEEAVRDSGINEGMVLVSAMHITAGVWINDDEPGIHAIGVGLHHAVVVVIADLEQAASLDGGTDGVVVFAFQSSGTSG